jgi:hypothetical protein
MKKQSNYFQFFLGVGVISLALGTSSCKKSSNDASAPTDQSTQTIACTGQTGGDISGPIKGTLCSGTYNVVGDVYVKSTDTLIIKPGVTINFQGSHSFIVQGSLFSLGSKDQPIWFTKLGLTKSDGTVTDPFSDPAYQGSWTGILCDTSTKYLVLKWTHVEFGGATLPTSPVAGMKNGQTSWMISFPNPKGVFVLEDSWIYGGVDDPIRIQGGKVHIMRNTFEKGGYQGGEYLNIKSGTVGNVAFNLFIGGATQAIKPSSNGGRNPETNIVAYNNTILNGGYRRVELGRGGSINFEEHASGLAYNNIIVNCKYGLRIVGATGTYSGNALVGADTANIFYGYNMNYVDSLSIANQIYPVGFYTKPQPTDIPTPSSFLPSGYTVGASYSASTSILGANNPMFVNYPLPQPSGKLSDISWAKGFDFHLKSGSPAIGKGYTGFTIRNDVPVDPMFGATLVNQPNKDLGAYPTDGNGNQHTY